jgi:hypothetical protein
MLQVVVYVTETSGSTKCWETIELVVYQAWKGTARSQIPYDFFMVTASSTYNFTKLKTLHEKYKKYALGSKR